MLVAARQMRRQRPGDRLRDENPKTGDQPRQRRGQHHHHRVLAGEVDHPPPRMPQRHMAQFMRDHARHLFGAHRPGAIFLHEAARQEDPPVRCGQPVHRVHVEHVHLDRRQSSAAAIRSVSAVIPGSSSGRDWASSVFSVRQTEKRYMANP